ncbi:hypothetical protein LMIY3S_02227 [Labrys miyagiensis]
MHAYRMKRRNLASLAMLKGTLLAATLLTAPAFAQNASADGAKQLQDSLTKTFGPALFEKGILSITAQGSAYAVKLDLNPAFEHAKKNGVTVSIDPLTYMATPNADGTYAVTSESPFNYSFAKTEGEDQASAKFSASCKSSGTFDPKIAIFSNYETSCPSASMTVNSPENDVSVSTGAISSKITGAAGSAGGVTISTAGTVADFVETITGKDKPLSIKVTAKQATSDGSVENFQVGAAIELIGIAAKAGNKDELAAQQNEIKQKLLAALPLWNNLAGKATLSGVNVETPIGPVALDSFEESVGLTGAVKQASYGIGIKYSGLKLPENPAIPSWAGPLIPAQGNIDVKFEGVDLDALARLAIQNFDVTKEPPIPDEVTAQALQIVMGGQPRVTLSPSTFSAPAGALSAEGSMNVFPNKKGTVTISTSDLDKLSDALGKAQIPNMPMLVAFAKGLAKSGADGKATWAIDFDGDTKAVSINGQVLNPGSAPGGEEGEGGDAGQDGNAPQQ